MMDPISRRSTVQKHRKVRPVHPLRRVLAAALVCASVSAGVMLGAGRADAISFRVTELSQCGFAFGVVSCVGEPITVGFRIESDPGERILGLSLSAHGYDESVVDFTSGVAVSSIFHGFALPGVGSFSGLSNFLVPAPAPGVVAGGRLAESAIGANGNRVQFFSGISLTSVTGNPLDPGLDGVVGGGDAHVRLTFAGGCCGRSYIRFGAGYPGDEIVSPDNILWHEQPDFFTLVFDTDAQPYIIPEPGSAILIGLGLALLARRRSSFPD